MKMIFISNNWADAHQQTRLQALSKLNLSIISIAALRNYYSVKSPFNSIFIGNIRHASYRKRVKIYFVLLYQLTKQTERNDFIYAFGFDLMLVCLIFKTISGKRIKVIYEVPDIRELFFSKSIPGKLIRVIEKIAIPKINLLVATSPNFISEYYIEFRKISVPDFLIIENKIHLPEIEKSLGLPVSIIPDHTRKIRIGYFGVLRCPASFDCLIKLSRNGRFEVILQGIFMPLTKHYEKVIQDEKHIHYLGTYQSPKDLNLIYSKVDIVWAVYPFSKNLIGNHLFARTNRFYECLFFKKPLIVQKGTADAKKAVLLGNIALEINLENEDKVVEFLAAHINPQNLVSMKKQLHLVSEKHYQITNEYKDLGTWLQLNR